MKMLEWVLQPTHFFFIVLLGPLFLALIAALIVLARTRGKHLPPGRQPH